ncbi:hypothetical protein [Candidatus Chloroploca asiatica]|uniref:DUF11 domain-containing protein n=1 Tax=Candidatus Chloroploca asiatica TaxID=1506545 RepID=A0A2H3LEB4_9CHLR|nr:hypothetical protein [Candidatus Chloroploca asiatica]PDW01046.1 hypothetical protein A9Q02_07765 [Candidatus Chloroploca asiatica]
MRNQRNYFLRPVLVAFMTLFALSLAFPSPMPVQASAPRCTDGYALWASNQRGDNIIEMSGSENRINGKTRSNADLRISGSKNQLTEAVEYGTLFQDGGDANRYPTPQRVAVSQPPVSYAISAYRPGGSAAQAAQADGRYQVINGDLDVSDPTTLNGLYYVTGDAKLSASAIRGTFTIVAEGSLDVSGSELQATAYADGLLFFANKQAQGASVIKLAGSESTLRGVIYGPGGTVELSGSKNNVIGMILGDALKLNGSQLIVSFAEPYCPGNPGTPPIVDPNPASIKLADNDISHLVSVINNVTFVTIQFRVANTGQGRADDVRLIIDRVRDDDDDDFVFDNFTVLQGSGVLQERSDDQLVASLGQGGTLPANSSVLVSATYRLRANMQDNHASNQLTFKLATRVLFSDTMGARATTIPLTLLPVATSNLAEPSSRVYLPFVIRR